MKGQNHRHSGNTLSDHHGLEILGHELGNVLHGLLGMAELLGQSDLTPEQCRWLRAIEHSGRQMASLIQSEWKRYPSTGVAVVPKPVCLDGVELLEQVVISHTPAARSGNNRLLLAVHPDLPRYWRQDACLVRQLLDNLVGNAIKFTRAGEIVIEAISMRVDGRKEEIIRLRVSDTGPGVGMAVADRPPEIPRRLNSSGETGTGDRGLGLYICHSIAAAMNGQITHTCPAGGGALFEVLLPGFPPGPLSPTQEFRSVLLDEVRCRLKLENTLGECVAYILARLGVEFCEAGHESSPSSDTTLDLVISEAEPPLAGAQPCLQITPCAHPGRRLRQRILEPPLLESSLGSLLLEIGLDWRSQGIRNESPGSSPKLR